ncbi:MAG: hypothetical protein AVDCRST_MAG41-4034 [uncultured Corynebacteriales bacterium]|uniref:DUF4232 domain-containing protein n=1 Tax=uncultured Mycobacteriales bacterium TaxID=581187 RepID=A0A6J4JSP4_9ACTN|nr:MAG: hypothetical protein AVDCRST_MAG41-4034 [uncultured Corynebacteriales bacterium]
MRTPVLVAAAVLIGIAGCSGEDTTATPGPSVTGTPGTGTPATSTPAPGTPAGTTAGTTPAAGPTTPQATTPQATTPGATPVASRCRTAELGLSFSDLAGTAGQRYGYVILRNIAARTCTVAGFGGLRPLDPARRALPVRLERGGPAPASLRLAPGQAAGTRIRFAGIPAGGTCVSPASVEVTPPDETEPLVTRWPWGPVCGGRIVGEAYGEATGS